ncbi:MAG TPA: hypothetical protein VFL86_25750 [Burkholderiaceae bacterium]|nr:hypothetical protein [Burkholderiaceae bacterium]
MPMTDPSNPNERRCRWRLSAASAGRAARRGVVAPLVVLAALMPLQAHAVFECMVKINHVLIYRDGAVNVHHTGRGDYTVVCNLNTDRLGVSPVTCAMWAAMLQHIKKNNGTANFYFDGAGSCATLPTYAGAPAPVYIGDMAIP